LQKKLNSVIRLQNINVSCQQLCLTSGGSKKKG
jgi:hypothetical protein